MEQIFKVPILNHWWQTETGSPITATCMGFKQSLTVPRYTTGLPFCGYNSRNIFHLASRTAFNVLKF